MEGTEMIQEYKSLKSNSRFIVKGEKNRAFLAVEGEAATIAKVQKQCENVRKCGGSFDEVCWRARQLARDF